MYRLNYILLLLGLLSSTLSVADTTPTAPTCIAPEVLTSENICQTPWHAPAMYHTDDDLLILHNVEILPAPSKNESVQMDATLKHDRYGTFTLLPETLVISKDKIDTPLCSYNKDTTLLECSQVMIMANYASGTSSSGKSAKSYVDVDTQTKTCVKASLVKQMVNPFTFTVTFHYVNTPVYCNKIHIGDMTKENGIVFQVSFDPLRGSHGLQILDPRMIGGSYDEFARGNFLDISAFINLLSPPGWRLPTKDELTLFYNQHKVLSNIINDQMYLFDFKDICSSTYEWKDSSSPAGLIWMIDLKTGNLSTYDTFNDSGASYPYIGIPLRSF